ncbi:basic helix-loop-helix (bHLH) DNA-binding superfamily protein [Artemisia annua]|uniref:Basic helix-loop-helix (BHLH) DNA-binding superfamily protein n=1 Tax=Artemisia annua TaxID=35608 RepID=A0A2U1Q8Y8_ARTAN|nr:basic helix-loop-helix (bHLH) DNA-binding superfamily protein [Artemisia annua]
MAISDFKGFSELIAMEDPPSFNFQDLVNSYDDHLDPMGIAVNSFDANVGVFNYYKPVMEPSSRPTKQIKTSSWNSSCVTNEHSLMNVNMSQQANLVTPKEETTVSSKINGFQFGPCMKSGFDNGYRGGVVDGAKNSTKVSHAQDHILAERKRREKLSQRFIALSALVPGLKKMDKASVLGDAIKHMKTLQEKVKTLEDQIKKRPNTESVVFVKRYEVLADNGESSSSNDGPINEQLPEIEARFFGNDVLIRIHCEKKKGVLEKILAEIEKLHLSVLNSTCMTFANYALDITVLAQLDKEFAMTMKDLVKNLRSAIKQFV